MGHQNDEAAALAGVAASRSSQSIGNNSSIADPKPDCNPGIVRPLTESSLVTAKQAHRFVRAVSRTLDPEYPTAWLLGIGEGAGPLSRELGIAPDSGPFGTVEEHGGLVYLNHAAAVILGTLLSAIALAVLPEPQNRAEAINWKDRFFELRDALLSIARRLLRPVERIDDIEIEACWLRKRYGVAT